MLALTITTWVLSGILAFMFLMAGGMKLAKPHADLPMPTLQVLSPGRVKFIGAAEVLGALGVILPPLFGAAPLLAPLAAIGLAIIQVLAVPAHRRLNEPFIMNILLAVLALAVAVLSALAFGGVRL
ncbi:putative integral membrane protein [Leucobacter sp. 7(1)]|uniref:DoxX family protein n=1 Tax=Leucobacter sp. 7(1) TaxID=1255613 RepID=UPI00097ED7EF|nr:DoxX family protein [Leucobacter sp. 7(1)]SJN08418.1 putative integral membrane protein [Leucobacter sp. 7(1)]